VLTAVIVVAWSAFAVAYADLRAAASPRWVWAGLVVALFAATLWMPARKWRVAAFASMFLAVLVWFGTRNPRGDRNWTPDVATTPFCRVEGDRLTVEGLRNFRWAGPDDPGVPVWETRTYDLSSLQSVDYTLCYWAGEAIAHAIVSFGFTDGEQLAISIETRKEQGEKYSALQGFFRQYELVYVFADERDVLGVRARHRNERLYMYRLRADPRRLRHVLLSYARHANQLRETPEFYNALMDNCSTNVMRHFSVEGLYISPWHISLILNGYSGRLAHDAGATARMSYDELRRLSYITEKARDVESPDFSARIRHGVPRPAQD
jgi:hypothetical protein